MDIISAKEYYYEKEQTGTFAKFLTDIVNVGIENFECDVQNYNGIEYANILTGADYEIPVSMFAYIDVNGELRAYVPYSGNYFNHDTWTAIGHSDDDEIEDIKYLINKYPELCSCAKAEYDEDGDEEDDNDDSTLPSWAYGIVDYAEVDDYEALKEFEEKCEEALI